MGVAFALTAQSSDFITPGERRTAAVNAENIAPSFFFDADAGARLRVTLTTESPTFIPIILLVDSTNAVIETAGGFTRGEPLSAEWTIPADGQYYLQVQGANGTGGTFTLALDQAPTPTPTHTPLPTINTPIATPPPGMTAEMLNPPAFVPTPIPNAPPENIPVVLSLSDENNTETATLDSTTRERNFIIAPSDAPVRLEIAQLSMIEGGERTFTIGLTARLLDARGRLVGVMMPPLNEVVFSIPAGNELYTLTLLYEGIDTLLYRVRVIPYMSSVAVLPTPTITATEAPTLSPTPAITNTPAPSDIDLSLRWTGTEFTLTNTSGAPLDVHDLAFNGGGRRVTANAWDATGVANVNALPANACLGLRPLAYPDAPALPPECASLAAWRVSDSFYFWNMATFEVLYNGTSLTTCDTGMGVCTVDMPNG